MFTGKGTPSYSRHLTDTAPAEISLPKRRNGALGSVVRKLFVHRPERSIGEINIQKLQLGAVQTDEAAHPKSATRLTASEGLIPQSPLAAHPLALAGTGDTAARISELLSPGGDESAASAPPEPYHSTQLNRKGTRRSNSKSDLAETGYQEKSLGTILDDSVSAGGERLRSQSISIVSEISPRRSHNTLRNQKSDHDISRIRKSTSYDHVRSATHRSPVLRPSVGSPNLPNTALLNRPRESSHLGKDTAVVVERQSASDARKTFDFESLMDAMQAREQVNLQTVFERMNAFEVKQMDLENTISKLQARLPADRPVSYRSPSTYELPAGEAVQHPPNAAPQSVRWRKLPQSKLQTQQPARQDASYSGHESHQRNDSTLANRNTAAVSSPAPNHHHHHQHYLPNADSPLVSVPAPGSAAQARQRDSVTLLTVEHYDSLVEMLRSEQRARSQLAGQVSYLQAEIASLRQLLFATAVSSTAAQASASSPTAAETRRRSMRRGSSRTEEEKEKKLKDGGGSSSSSSGPAAEDLVGLGHSGAAADAGRDRENFDASQRFLGGQGQQQQQQQQPQQILHKAPPSPAASHSSGRSSSKNAKGTDNHNQYCKAAPEDAAPFGADSLPADSAMDGESPAGQAF